MRRVLLALLPALLLVGCVRDGTVGGLVVLENQHTVAPGERLAGDLVLLGGKVTVSEGARVTGGLFVLGGRADVAGTVEGDIALPGGEVQLASTAVVGGDVRVGGNGTLARAAGVTVRGAVIEGPGLGLPEFEVEPPSPRRQLTTWLLQALVLGGLGYLYARQLPGGSARVAAAAVEHTAVAGALGVLSAIVGLVVLVMMAFTVILIPVALLLGIGLGASVLIGWLALGRALGLALARRLDRPLPIPMATFIGTIALSLGANVVGLVPLVGPPLPLLAMAVALGAVMLTGYGVRRYTPPADTLALPENRTDASPPPKNRVR